LRHDDLWHAAFSPDGRQALTWLRADLALWARRAADRPLARAQLRKALEHWQRDPDLAGLRDEAALGKLAPEEAQACRRLWAEVAAVRDRAQAG
jgi:hypothetical protein